MRFKLTIEYDGTPYVGWQKQKDGLGIQEVIERAVVAFAGEEVEVVGAGRTDAGVHALAQTAHFDLSKEWEADTVRNAINANIDKKHKVAVLSAVPAADDFHARFSAVERMYVYNIVNRKARLALEADRAWWVPTPLSLENMKVCAEVLIGNHDFSSFRAAECQSKSPVKTLDEITITSNYDEISFFVRAKSFLHHQVRNIVGTLYLAGQRKINRDDMQAILDAKDRTKAGPTAPAHGLYLVGVKY